MVDTPEKNTGTPQAERGTEQPNPEAAFASDSSISVEAGVDGIERNRGGGQTIDTATGEIEGGEPKEETDGSTEEAEASGDQAFAAPSAEELEALVPKDLPTEFTADSEENVAAFTAAYTDEDGGLRLDVLSAEYFHNGTGEGKKPGLSEPTVKFLAHRHQMSEADVNTIVGQLAAGTAANASLVAEQRAAIVGGKDNYNVLIDWANEKYDTAARKRLDAALKSGDMATMTDALELLRSRYQAATGTATIRRKGAPQRDAVRGASGSGAPAAADGYKDRAEYDNDWRRAWRAWNPQSGTGPTEEDPNPPKIEEVRKKLKASNWYGPNQRNMRQRKM